MVYLRTKGIQAKYLTDGLIGLAENLRGDNAKDFIDSLETFKKYSKQPPRKLTDIDTGEILTREKLEEGKVKRP